MDVMRQQYWAFQKRVAQRVQEIGVAVRQLHERWQLDEVHGYIIVGFDPRASFLSVPIEWAE